MYCYIFELVGESFEIPCDEVLSILLSNNFQLSSHYNINKFLFVFIPKNKMDENKRFFLREEFKNIASFTR